MYNLNSKCGALYLNDFDIDFSKDKVAKPLNPPELSSLAIDEAGVIWIGTVNNGIIRMDNKTNNRICTYNSPLTSNNIGEIIIDNKNRKWFITGNNYGYISTAKSDTSKNAIRNYAGVVMLNDVNFNQLSDWKIFNSFNSTLPNKTIERFLFDKNDNLWISAADKGIGKFHDSTWHYNTYYNNGFVKDDIDYLTISEYGEVYAGSKII